MPYRIEKSEPLSEGLRRIAVEQIEAALKNLRAPEKDRQDGVHRCRKSLKKTRALLRLVRMEIGDELYRLENGALREISAKLSAMRDADVLIDTLTALRQWAGPRLAADDVAALARSLEESRADIVRSASIDGTAVAQAIDGLEPALDRARRWPIERNRFVVIEGGIRRTYRSGRRSYAAALEDRTEESLHEWRKQVKYLWYMTRLIGEALERSHASLVDDLDQLAVLLGDDRDLGLLREVALASRSDEEIPASIIRLIDTRREELQQEAKSLGARLYSRKPKAFVKGIRTDWDEWRPVTVVMRQEMDARALRGIREEEFRS